MFASGYAKFRTSKYFLVGLAVFIPLWVIWNSLPWTWHFDNSGFERLNLFLSTEASLSVALLMMDSQKQEALQRQQLMYLQHLMEAAIKRLETNLEEQPLHI